MSDSPSHRESNRPSTPSNSDLARAAKLLLGCYRAGDASDPEVYVSAVMAVLGSYSQAVIAAVVDPRNGLPSKLKWLPSVAEIKDECEYHAEKEAAAERWEEARNAARLPPPAPKPRPSLDELRAKYGPNWGLKTMRREPTREEARQALIAQIGQAAFDAIPDAKESAA